MSSSSSLYQRRSTTTAIALWQQLQQVAQTLAAVRSGQSATAALKLVAPELRAGVQSLLYHVLRWLGRAEALRRKLAPRTPPPRADALLCTALALAWQEEGAPYDAFTLVDQAVEAAKRHAATRAQARFINACLRRFLRERDALLDATAQEPMAMWNHPRWWIDRLRRDYPRRWQDILHANNAQAPMVLRVNVLRIDPDQYLEMLHEHDMPARRQGEVAIVLTQARPVHDIPGFAEGLVSVQDAGAQMAAPLLLKGLHAAGTMHILDACAAPGGKTAHLLEYAGAAGIALHVAALDIDAARCVRIDENLVRLGLCGAAQVLAADARDPAQWWRQQCAGRLFDAILLDAPCTASGIVRRRPDVRWLRRESDVAQLAIVQAGLLTTLWPLLKPGGRLLYCTCSVFRAEGEQQIQTFLAHNGDAILRPSPGHLIPQNGANAMGVPDNQSGDHDGFFYALLEKHMA
ncbi:16S rRNA (cytosine(967)-C(5))-methyltransferase RsmB [Ramlibacter sp. H39-3-26]|uniref:16S rRNA (cytosine(967)-C(5))-methyltransferase RsmB n=1 Tax=Curvibacter soli TaxID=3031331 RepID=UPI0023DCA5EE|nr:16S rRNA (cytosine(967)-C(5))-methyltransferase RsmB [Ramlibacter sp. H39-3-26]MDF1485916.1 16S rRNA (cytosine(967)-C(5))-methyltransferase RsmB [Ramlibacter sp. H39-3-26]